MERFILKRLLDWKNYIPLFIADQADQLIGLALEKRKQDTDHFSYM